jgi:TrmH family RNA methyltransferase
MEAWKGNVFFVLVEPWEAGNIGASARAMKNMGFHELRLVRPRGALNDEARWFARGALDVLEGAKTYASLGDALRDAALVVGTTRRKGRRRGVFLPIEEGAAKVRSFARANRVAVLFGGEKLGLSNAELGHCGILLTIPTSGEQPSLNLAQAVLIAAYEISKAGAGERVGKGVIDHGELEALGGRIEEVLGLLGYGLRGDRDLGKKVHASLKRMMGRAGLTPGEAVTLHGLCSRIEKKLKGG